MRKKFYIALLGLITVSCNQLDIDTYQSEDTGIYFQKVSSYVSGSTSQTYTDSVVVSFAAYAANTEEVLTYAPVVLMGLVKDYDRPFRLRVDEEHSTAVLNEHFRLNLDSLYIPANSNTFNIPVVLIRHKDLKTRQLRIELLLEENENFSLLIRNYKNSNNWNATDVTLDGTRWKIIFDEQYTEPGYWTSFAINYFGKWTLKKYVFLNELMGWSHLDWLGGGGSKVALGRFSYAANRLKDALQARADQGEPLYEEDGSLMQLPSPYEVDYSAYVSDEN